MTQILHFLKPRYNGHPDAPRHIINIVLLPVYVFRISFAIGTLLFLLYITTQCDVITLYGFFYVIGAFIVNSVCFIALIICATGYPKHAGEILLKAVLLLLNIPIALLYLYLLDTIFSMNI